MSAHLPLSGSRLRGLIEEFLEDEALVDRRWPLAGSTGWAAPRQALLDSQTAAWEELDFDGLDPEARTDWVLMSLRLQKQRALMDQALAEQAEAATAAPFLALALQLEEERMDFRFGSAEDAARLLDRLAKDASEAEKQLAQSPPSPQAACMALRGLETAGKALGSWEAFFLPYSPDHHWWCRSPLDTATAALASFRDALIRASYGVEPDKAGDVIVGRPIGRGAIAAELARDLIFHTPEELIAIAQEEMAWCRLQAEEAAAAMGFGRDWRAAQEKVKQSFAPVGQQWALIADMAFEAASLMAERDWVTVPDLCRNGWRMTMMPRERQKTAPFFLGGETIMVSQPTHDMGQEEKLMSARGNNPAFSRATVQHELIPGHHLQFYAVNRRRPYRHAFSTPFWIEGWTMHWEFLLWNEGFPQTPEHRLGMLFWRMHRCARVAFSLKYHLGAMTPDECVEMLVDQVGHEPSTAQGEVRRSVGPDYPASYQCAYLLGGMQVHALHAERLAAGQTHRAFHDGFLDQNMMPIELLALVMRGAEIPQAPRPAAPLLDRWVPGGRL